MAAPCTHVVGLRATFSVAITFCLLSDDSALATGLNAASATSLNLLSTSCNLDLWPPKLRSWSFPALARIEHLCQFALKSVTSLLKYCVYKFDNRRTKSVVYVDIECVQDMIWTWQKCKQHCFSRIDYLSVRTKIRCFLGGLCVCVCIKLLLPCWSCCSLLHYSKYSLQHISILRDLPKQICKLSLMVISDGLSVSTACCTSVSVNVCCYGLNSTYCGKS